MVKDFLLIICYCSFVCRNVLRLSSTKINDCKHSRKTWQGLAKTIEESAKKYLLKRLIRYLELQRIRTSRGHAKYCGTGHYCPKWASFSATGKTWGVSEEEIKLST